MNRADATPLTELLRDLARILEPFIDACEPCSLDASACSTRGVVLR